MPNPPIRPYEPKDRGAIIGLVRELHDGHRFYDSFSQKSGPGTKSGTTSETLGGPEAPSPRK